MSLGRFILVVAILGGGWKWWHHHSEVAAVATVTSDRGFVDMPPPSGLSDSDVVIFAPKNCPSDGAQRAESLASDLAAKGIVVARADEANFDDLPDAATAERVGQIMSGPIPIVFVHGRAKANPSLDDVLAEYHGGKSG